MVWVETSPPNQRTWHRTWDWQKHNHPVQRTMCATWKVANAEGRGKKSNIIYKLMSCSHERHETQSSKVTKDQKKPGKHSLVMVSFPIAVGDAVVVSRAGLLLGKSFWPSFTQPNTLQPFSPRQTARRERPARLPGLPPGPTPCSDLTHFRKLLFRSALLCKGTQPSKRKGCCLFVCLFTQH